MKIAILSDSPTLATGFSNQSKLLAKYLTEKGHEIHYLANGYSGQTIKNLELEDGTKFPYKIHGQLKQYFQGELGQMMKKIRPDILYILLDTFMLHGQPRNPVGWFLNEDTSPAQTVFWFPSDGGGRLPLGCENILKKCNQVVAMSEFGKKQVKDIHNIDSEHIPHGTEPNRFYKLDDVKRVELRRKWNLEGKFVIGSVFRNQPRKNPDKYFKTFNLIKDKIPNAVLLLHTDPNDPAGQILLQNQIKKYNLENRVKFTGMNAFRAFDWNEMNEVYNLMDIFFLPTCFHPDTQIITPDGSKKIKDIEIGDKVVTKDGTFKQVEDTIESDFEGELLNISTSYNPDVKLTPNHKVYGMRSSSGGSYWKNKLKKNPNIELKPINEFKEGDYLVIPRIKKTKDKTQLVFGKSYISNQFGKDYVEHPRSKNPGNILIDEDLVWLFGYYLAEGCISQKDEKPEGIVFSCNTNEREYTQKVKEIVGNKFGLECSVFDDTRNRRTIRVYSSSLGRKFKNLFGSGAKNKKMPEWMLYLPKEKQEKLVKGYFDGDGHLGKDDRKYGINWNIQTVSKNLAHQMRLVFQRLGKLCSLKIQDREGQNRVYRLRFFDGGKNSIGWIDEDFMYVRINKIEKEKYKGKVYDLTIEDNHNYCTYWLGKNSGEGFGIPIIEAMSCEVPVVATSYTTTPELVELNNCGFGVKLTGTEKLDLFQLHSKDYDIKSDNGTMTGGAWEVERGFVDINDAANKIINLYKNPELREKMGKNGRNAVLAKYDFKIIGEKWEKLMKQMLWKK